MAAAFFSQQGEVHGTSRLDAGLGGAIRVLQPGEQIQAVVGAQTASQWLAALTGIFVFLGFNKYRILAVTPSRILVLDAGKTSMKTARGVVLELPRFYLPRAGHRHVAPHPGGQRNAARAPPILQGPAAPPTPKPPPPDPGLADRYTESQCGGRSR